MIIKIILILSFFSFQIQLKGQDTIIVDNDGNEYRVVKIGNQEWMTENLRTTRYRNGEKIVLVEKSSDWSKQVEPAYCWYSNDSLQYSSYGAIYNWYVVKKGDVCPSGWRIPNDRDWKKLIKNIMVKDSIKYVDIKSIASKEGWVESEKRGTVGYDTYLNNSFGFSASPIGCRYSNGTFDFVGGYCGWWSKTNFIIQDLMKNLKILMTNHKRPSKARIKDLAHYWIIEYDEKTLIMERQFYEHGFQIRCIKE